MKPPLVVGNWKMHGTRAEALNLARQIRNAMRDLKHVHHVHVEVALAPPFTALGTVGGAIIGKGILLAAQNVHWEEEGAFTGEISPRMLREVGCSFVMIGHSERRHLFNESDQMVAKKLLALLRAGLSPILCVGETLEERRRGTMMHVISRQLRTALKGVSKNAIEMITVAYEPVWAIGTGHNATPDQISHAHRWIREVLQGLFGKNRAKRNRILYGGSVKPENAAELARASEVNGSLVGGASLKAEDFLTIIREFAES
ncbi:MAG: triose-phosphate isomerase [Candidatus Binatia bacterium]